jgi:hypothetical protein
MGPDDFRKLALGLPGACEQSHMGHPDFRIGKKVFASLGYPDANWGMVKLTPEQQEVLLDAEPQAFRPAAGAWGRQGNTLVLLPELDQATAESVLRMARENISARR